MNKIITIGRQFGSGGRELGRRIADLLGWAYYDNEIITEISKKTELAESYVKQIVEHSPVTSFPITIGQTFFPTVLHTDFEQATRIYVEQTKIIKEMAEKSNCVIVGRCADYILRDYNPFRIFVFAMPQSRIERCKRNANVNEDVSENRLWRLIRRVDRQRAKYYSFYTGRAWGERNNYDLCINTTNADIKSVAQALAKMLQPSDESQPSKATSEAKE